MSTQKPPAPSILTPLQPTGAKPFPDDSYWNLTGADHQAFDLSLLIRTLLQTGSPKTLYIEPKTVHVLLSRVCDYYVTRKCALLEVSAPVNICGDTHGQYTDLLRIFNACGAPTRKKYLFLGDYIDRGRHSIEVITLLLALKLAVPKNVHLLRGNHELRAINKNYGFYAEIKTRYRGRTNTELLYEHYNQVFSFMPLSGLVSKRILCMHGGISPHLKSFDDIRSIPLPLETAKSHPLACDLLWADPDGTSEGFMPNKVRAISHTFGPSQVKDVCAQLDIDLIIRAHQVVEYGYAFFCERKLITVFSASRYQEELHNYAAVVVVNKNLELSFVQLKPEEFEKRRDENERGGNVEQVTANNPQN